MSNEWSMYNVWYSMPKQNIPILMANVDCETESSNFLECQYEANKYCTHNENIFLNCF